MARKHALTHKNAVMISSDGNQKHREETIDGHRVYSGNQVNWKLVVQ